MSGSGEPVEAAGPRRRGRRAVNRTENLTREDIVTQALAIIRVDGVDGLTMRRLATELGVTPMGIYHYFSDRTELLGACVAAVWDDVLLAVQSTVADGDLIEVLVQGAIQIRRVWLENSDLASLSVAVAEPGEAFLADALAMASVWTAAGFPDVGLAYNAMQTYTIGSIQMGANRRTSNRVFGRDPKKALAQARRMLTKAGASTQHRAVVEGRFEEGDDLHFEAGLRALIAGLLAGEG